VTTASPPRTAVDVPALALPHKVVYGVTVAAAGWIAHWASSTRPISMSTGGGRWLAVGTALRDMGSGRAEMGGRPRSPSPVPARRITSPSAGLRAGPVQPTRVALNDVRDEQVFADAV
jgi:hypothetical protein